MVLFKRCLPTLLMFACVAASAWAQEAPAQNAPAAPPASPPEASPAPLQPGQTQAPPDKRVFGVLPNYRTANQTAVYTPISAEHKFVIGLKDSFDYPLLLLAGAFAGLGQVTNQHPQFGQGMAGFGRRIGTGYADQAIGNMMTESIYPSLLREDEGSLIPDFMLQPLGSDFADILDLKRPDAKVVSGRKDRRRFAQCVHEAIAQVREYREYFEHPDHRRAVQERYGFTAYRPDALIVIGRQPEAVSDEEMKRIAGDIPSFVQIQTYDDVLRKMRQMVELKET